VASFHNVFDPPRSLRTGLVGHKDTNNSYNGQIFLDFFYTPYKRGELLGKHSTCAVEIILVISYAQPFRHGFPLFVFPHYYILQTARRDVFYVNLKITVEKFGGLE